MPSLIRRPCSPPALFEHTDPAPAVLQDVKIEDDGSTVTLHLAKESTLKLTISSGKLINAIWNCMR
jgi:hypothetical protein